MKKIFYIGITGIILFEFLKVYFIMPMPGSQQMNSIDGAYFLHSNRWLFRIIFCVMIAVGLASAFKVKYKWIPFIFLVLAAAVTWQFNFKLTADHMFLQPASVVLKSGTENKINGNRIILGIENNGDAKAYPVSFLAYHHQVQDTIGGTPIIVTYCSVCRSGRVFKPLIDSKHENFRLVGMDHFNAMFEDESTKSWWRQENGIAVAGKMKGNALPEMLCNQMTLAKWLELYPNSLVLQPDPSSEMNYDSLARFERGKSIGNLTRTDSISWKEKSWVIGIQAGNLAKAYDWNDLKKERIINDFIGDQPVVLVLSFDGQSFAAFERKMATEFTLQNDTLFEGNKMYDFAGHNLQTTAEKLNALKAYQEFWHSWRTFHPNTMRYSKG